MRSVAKLVAAAVVAGVLLFSSPAEARRHHAQPQVQTQEATLQVPMEAIYQSEFAAFMKTHQKEYTADEFFLRYNVFKANYDFIQKHNAEADQGLHTFRTGLNQHCDLTLAEFSRFNTYKSANIPAPSMAEWEAMRPAHWNATNLGRPDYVDLRQNGLVTGVKNQQQCGSCWAFGSVAGMESAHAKAGKGLVSLSEQQLVDCSGSNYGTSGCNGGNIEGAYQYAIDNGGLTTEDSYPYTASGGQCHASNSAAQFTGYSRLPNDEGAMADAVANNGVVSVGIDASTQAFQTYASGIYSGDCSTVRDHAVAIVGYGWDQPSGKNFWIVKNSWGGSWGSGGYIWMQRDVNMCGINGDASYPHSN